MGQGDSVLKTKFPLFIFPWVIAFATAIAIAGPSQTAILDIQPDCSERKIQIDEIIAIAEKPEIKTMVQFLGALPKGSLQTFTFVTDTRSLQHHLTSEQWPRVLRASADGKIVMSFVCNPASQDYGAVEMLHFEDAPVARWKSLSLKFDAREPKYKNVEAATLTGVPSARVSRDSSTCLKCHGVGSDRQMLRPIYSSYPTWAGFFGSNDDTLFHGSRELTNYQQFRKTSAQDPCFQTLPWPKKVPAGYENYPYHALAPQAPGKNPYRDQNYIRELKTTNYHLRPNLKFTDTQSHLLAIQLAHNLMRKRDYLRVSPLLAMESLGCQDLDLDVELAKTLGSKYKKPKYLEEPKFMDPRSTTSGSLRLYTVASLLGITPAEWTLNFNSQDPEFATGVQGAYGQDTSVSRLVQSLLLQDLAKSVPGLKENFRLSRGVSAFFKDQDFSCVDDLGGAIEFDKIENQKAMCQSLAKAYREKVGESLTPLPMPILSGNGKPGGKPGSASNVTLAQVRKSLLQEYGKTEKSGRAVADMYCVACHGKDSYLPEAYHFLNSEAAFKKAVAADPLLLFRAFAHIESGRMPVGYILEDKERRSLQGYLLKTAGGSL